MREVVLAFDTSNYTTSCALFDGTFGVNAGRLLDVEAGQLGLRQSEALFSHIRRMPQVFEQLDLKDCRVIAVGASTKPRETEDSYMPCFLAGASHGAVLAKALSVPFFEFSHQQGHIASAAWSASRQELLDTAHLAWHLSGGTTELLFVHPDSPAVTCEIVGGTTDVSAGQLIDRTGQLLGLSFPSGKALDQLACEVTGQVSIYQPKVTDCSFSLSGVEHKMKQMFETGVQANIVAYFVLMSLISAIKKVTENALKKFGNMPVLFSGGVASNSLLRQYTPDGIFAEPRYSVDNALGVAILTYRAVMADG